MDPVLAFGEILWDIIEGLPHLGGAPFNFAAHLRDCGVPTAILSSVGDDTLGNRARDAARGYDVDTSFLLKDPHRPTGTVSVSLLNGIPSYTIHEGVAWDAICYPPDTRFPDRISAFYFGTLAQRSICSRKTLFQLLARYPDVPVFLDVNLRQKFWGREILDQSMQKATILKINDEEARILSSLFFSGGESLESFSSLLFQRYPRIQIILVTLGADGCWVTQRDGDARTVPAEQVSVVDTVGAGDAFAAAFLATLLEGESPFRAAEEGNRRGGKVASSPGAIPESCMKTH